MTSRPRPHHPIVRRAASLAVIACVSVTTGALTSPSRASMAERWTVSADLRLSSPRGGSAFDRLPALAVGPHGELALPEQGLTRLAVLDSTGSPLLLLGIDGPDSPPFTAIEAIDWVVDTIVIRDEGADQIRFLTPAGAKAGMIKAHMKPRRKGYWGIFGERPLSNGQFAGELLSVEATDTKWPLVRMTDDGKEAGEVAILARRGPTQLPVGSGRVKAWLDFQPFSDGTLWAAHRDGSGIVVVDRMPEESSRDAGFRVRAFAPDGAARFDRHYPYSPITITDGARDSAATRAIDLAAQKRDSLKLEKLPTLDAIRKALYLPAHRPPVTAVVGGRDGTIWLRREMTRPDSVMWMVLDARGEVLADVMLPATLTVHDADRAHVWGVEEHGVRAPEIVRLRLGRG